MLQPVQYLLGILTIIHYDNPHHILAALFKCILTSIMVACSMSVYNIHKHNIMCTHTCTQAREPAYILSIKLHATRTSTICLNLTVAPT